MLTNVKIYLSSIPRRAWWLIFWAGLYVALAFGYLVFEIKTGIFSTEKSRFSDYLLLGQMVWVVVSAIPLIPGTRLNLWLFATGTSPFYLIQERGTNHYVKVMANQPLFTENRSLAQRFWNLKEAKAHCAYLQSRRTSLDDEYKIIPVFQTKAKK